MANSLRVLLVDCDPRQSEQICSRLASASHSVLAAGGLQEAAEFLEIQRFDAVLVAPPADGANAGALAEFAGKLRTLDASQRSAVHTPLLSLSAPEKPGAFPADGYLVPGFDPGALAETVAGLAHAVSMPSASGAALPVFDFEKLRKQAGDDRELISEIVALFLSDQASQFAEMRQALEIADYCHLSRVAHTLKGSFGTLGAMVCWSRAQQLEYAAKQGNEANCRELLPSLEDALQCLLPHLEALRSEPSRA